MIALKTVWHDILLVWTFFTRIPAPPFMTERKLSQALWALPLVGLIIAFAQVMGATLALYWLGFSPFLFGVVMVLAPMLLTGGLHWDGLADVFDGLGVSKSRRLEVMRDPHVGAFGVMGLVGLSLLYVATYASV